MPKTGEIHYYKQSPSGEGDVEVELAEIFIDRRFDHLILPPRRKANLLTKSLTLASRECMLIVDSTAFDGDIAMAGQVWEAAVASEAMCVRQGRAGWVEVLSKYISSTLFYRQKAVRDNDGVG